MKKGWSRRTAELAGALIAAFILFAGYMEFYESRRPTWVHLTPPELLTPVLPAREQSEISIRWHGYRQRAVADARWMYALRDTASNAMVHKAEYSATSHEKSVEEGPAVYTRPLPRLPPGLYELTVRERSFLYAWWPTSIVHEQARFNIRFTASTYDSPPGGDRDLEPQDRAQPRG